VRLAIDSLLPAIQEHLASAPNLVLEAPPGAGKTTRVPPALLDLGPGDVLVLEPRRIAARMAARFVATERGEPVGETVGYQVRFEEVAGPRTRVRFLTEGVLTRRLLSDPRLSRVSSVVLDEFHERRQEGDLALALLRRLQKGSRPDLRLVAMSATLDAAPLAAYLGNARTMRCQGRQYPLEIEYTPHSSAPLEQQVAAALERLEARGLAGHTLVFLPGAAEIRRVQAACSAFANRRGWHVLPLYGDQAAEEQDRAVAPSAERKIILATNVAESSITIEGVTAVIDSGLARAASHSPWSGLPVLQTARISQASANQRAGRAGRTGPGRVVRLYPLEDFVRRPAQDVPEIARADLAPAALLLDVMGTGFDGLEWLDAPPAAAVEQARDLLEQLGALGPLGKEMARYPLHPRLSRLILEASRRGVAEDGCTVAALLSAGERLPPDPDRHTRSDLLALMDSRWQPQTERMVRQVRRIADPPRRPAMDPSRNAAREDALLVSVLAAFPDRVARRRQAGELLLAGGGAAQLAASSTVNSAPFLVAVEAEDRRDQKLPLVRLASAIEPEWLLDLFPERVREISRLEWNRAAERVEQLDAMMFGEIAIEESRGVPDPDAAAALLAEKALEACAGRFMDAEELADWEGRIAFASGHGQAGDLPHVDDALRELSAGFRSFAELEAAARDGGLRRALERRMTPAERRLLDEIAPERIRLPSGRHVRVHYEPDRPPWIASRLQDFFGMRQTPAVARGLVPVVVRLLAPNQRPVQMTSDLAGFWQRLYPQVRKELARRYPKHKWPEDPFSPY
jgi:ATP-dependent helicase HrpB